MESQPPDSTPPARHGLTHQPSHSNGLTHGDGHAGHHGLTHGHGHSNGSTHGHRHGGGRDRIGLWARISHLVTPHSHDATEAIQTAEEASSDGIRAAWISLGGMGLTAVLQIVIVAVSGSIALLADTLHNLGHLVTTIPLVIAFRLGRREPTKRYPFGFRRAEDLVGLLIALVIALSAVLIVWESINALVDPRPLTHLGWVFAAGLIGAVGNELVAMYRIRVGRRIGSAALIAEGNHARADGFTSIAVVLGVIGVWLGFPRADAIVGLLIAVAILWILVQSAVSVVRRLMDGVEPGLVDEIQAVAAAVPGVQYVDDIRARWSGHRLEAQLTLGVDAKLTVGEGHQLAEHAHHELLHRVPHLHEVSVHIHPSHDGVTPPDVHVLTHHHSSPAARAAYQQAHGR